MTDVDAKAWRRWSCRQPTARSPFIDPAPYRGQRRATAPPRPLLALI
jgi:hypothetical protein